MCKWNFNFELQLSSYWQNIKFSRYCPKFHIFTNFVNFQVYLQLFKPTASSLYILWQGHARNTLFSFLPVLPVARLTWTFQQHTPWTVVRNIRGKEGDRDLVVYSATTRYYAITMHFKRKVIVFSSSSSRFLLNLSIDNRSQAELISCCWAVVCSGHPLCSSLEYIKIDPFPNKTQNATYIYVVLYQSIPSYKVACWVGGRGRVCKEKNKQIFHSTVY